MIKAMVTLVTYQDWVYAHPDPGVVRNYMLTSGSTYTRELNYVQTLMTKGWHSSGEPSEIDWVAVTQEPKPLMGPNGEQATSAGHRIFKPAVVTIVFNRTAGNFYSSAGQVVAHAVDRGKLAFSMVLSQGEGAQWRIAATTQLHPVGGLGGLAR